MNRPYHTILKILIFLKDALLLPICIHNAPSLQPFKSKLQNLNMAELITTRHYNCQLQNCGLIPLGRLYETIFWYTKTKIWPGKNETFCRQIFMLYTIWYYWQKSWESVGNIFSADTWKVNWFLNISPYLCFCEIKHITPAENFDPFASSYHKSKWIYNYNIALRT